MRSLSSILSPEQLQNYQASIQFWAIIDTPAKRHLNGVSLAGRWWPAYSGICLDRLSALKNLVKVGTPSDKTFWIRAWINIFVIFALLLMEVNFTYWPLLQFLSVPQVYLKDGVCKFPVSFASNPVLAIAIKICPMLHIGKQNEMRNIKNAK